MSAENRLFVKVEKCEFHSSSVSFNGGIPRELSLLHHNPKVSAVAERLTPPVSSSNDS